MKKSLITAAVSAAFIFTVLPVKAETFRFKYTKDEAYKILSTVNEDVYVNGDLSHNAEIINRINVNVTDVLEDGSGVNSATFMTTENAAKPGERRHFAWNEEYFSTFTRSTLGEYTIADEYFMPVVRNVPAFPEQDVKIGDKWTVDGHEAHDLRRQFAIEKPFKVPFTANYTYAGTIDKNGTKLHVIKAQYTLQFKSPVSEVQTPSDLSFEERDRPYYTMGYSDQTIYFDNERGAIDSYSEHFRIVIETYYGNVLEFNGTAKAEITERRELDKDTFKEVQEEIEKLNIENTAVKEDDTGITISLENIQFKANSAELLDSEKEKLDKISGILKKFPNNDLLISGHTALAGTAGARLNLSRERAKAVAQYLIQLEVKDEYHVYTQGFGAEKPVASNDTIEGMARNRRVEITILK